MIKKILFTSLIVCIFLGVVHSVTADVTVTSQSSLTVTSGSSLTVLSELAPLISAGLVENVQPGTLVFNGSGQVSTSTTISAVDTSRSVVLFGGFSTTNASINGMESDAVRLWLADSTTVQGTRGAGDTHTVETNFVVVQFATGVTESVQQQAITMGTTDLGATSTISSVDTSRSIAIYGGSETDDPQYNRAITVLNLVSATEVTAVRRASGGNGTTTSTTVQFAAGVTISVQQVTTILLSTQDSATTTISSIDPNNTLLFYGGINSSGTATDLWHAYTYLSDSTSVILQRRRAGTGLITNMVSVVEFNSAYLNSSAQRGQNLIESGELSTTTPITTVDISKTILSWLGHFRGPTSTGGQTTRYSTRIGFQDGSNLVTTRANSTDNASTSWHLIESK